MQNSVFKKSSANGKITVYLGKRDFVDHISHVDPIGNLSHIHLTVIIAQLLISSFSQTVWFSSIPNT